MEELFTKLLGLPSVEVTLAAVDDREITLHCRSILASSHCPLCLEKCNKVKDRYTRELRDLSISGKKVRLLFTVRQFVCTDCNRHFHERHDFVAKNRTMTQRYEDFIYYRCHGVDLRYVCLQEDVCWTSVRDIFQRGAEREIASRSLFSEVSHIGIDEIALRKGHKDYVCVLVNLETGAVIDILPDRGKEYLKSYFLGKGEAFCEAITCFCSDMWEGYLNCAKEVFPNATIVADRFHFFAHMNKELDRCRRALRKKHPEDDGLKGLKWALLKPVHRLSAEESESIEKVLGKEEYRLLKRTWEARNGFREILEKHCSKEEAEKLIGQWQDRHTEEPNRFVQRFVDFFQKWKSYILNYFVHRRTTSPVEGINNKLKVIKRRAYGFLTFQAFRLRAIVEFD